MALIIFINMEYARSRNLLCLDPFFQPTMPESREKYLEPAWIEPRPSAWQASALTITPRPFGLTQLLVTYSQFLSTCLPVADATVGPVGCQGSVMTGHEVEVGIGLRRREQVHLQQPSTTFNNSGLN